MESNSNKKLERIDAILLKPIKVMKQIGAGVLFIMMLLMTADVVGRYFFKHPILGTDELVGVLNACLAAVCLGYAQGTKQHIRVDIVFDRMSTKIQDILNVFAYILALAIAFLISWQMIKASIAYFLGVAAGAPVSIILSIPWYPFIMILGIGFAVYGLIVLADLIASIIKIRSS